MTPKSIQMTPSEAFALGRDLVNYEQLINRDTVTQAETQKLFGIQNALSKRFSGVLKTAGHTNWYECWVRGDRIIPDPVRPRRFTLKSLSTPSRETVVANG